MSPLQAALLLSKSIDLDLFTPDKDLLQSVYKPIWKQISSQVIAYLEGDCEKHIYPPCISVLFPYTEFHEEKTLPF